MEEDLLYAIQASSSSPEKMTTSVETDESAVTENHESTPNNKDSASDSITATLEEVISRANNNSPAIAEEATTDESTPKISEDTPVVLNSSEEPTSPVTSTSPQAPLDDSTSNPELAEEVKDQIVVAKKRGRTRKKSNFKTEEERKEYNRLRQAKYRAIKRQSADAFLNVTPEKKRIVRRGRRSMPYVEPVEVVAPKKPLILRQKREKTSAEKWP